jgi:hypothetical protein
MDGSDFSVYGEAKGEYTRQLCVSLVPTLETYFLDMFETAKGESPHPSKVLWQFQTMLQAIPEWNQDKVLRETEKIQNDCKCDYLEELLTAVFIAHTKVLSAIRLTTKQKKLQITIPKLDHFLHRVLSDSARQLWTNVFLFTDTSSIEKQKNLRQVAELLRESILQAIRGMLPVKNILREYLHEDEEEEQEQEKEKEKEKEKEQQTPITQPEEEKAILEEAHVTEEITPVITEGVPIVEETVSTAPEITEESSTIEEKEKEKEEEVLVSVPEQVSETAVAVAAETAVEEEAVAASPHIIHIDAKSAVSFQQGHTFFSSDNLNSNEIQDVPFAEAELREDEEDEEDDEDEDEFEEIDSVQITDEFVSLDAEELY